MPDTPAFDWAPYIECLPDVECDWCDNPPGVANRNKEYANGATAFGEVCIEACKDHPEAQAIIRRLLETRPR